uniref:Uncharacterized protein n=1 Tax=Anguilla anguilla TaxID=7936 RepID=A0A0E9XPD3_ANGAN
MYLLNLTAAITLHHIYLADAFIQSDVQ